MPTDAQAAMREKFLTLYFCGPLGVRSNLKTSARAAGYSLVAVTYKQQKLRRYVAEEEEKRRESRTPQVFRDPNTGKVSFSTHELPGERRTGGTGASPSPGSNTAPLVDIAWYNDPIDGQEQRLYFDHNGIFKGEVNFGQRMRRPSKSFANSYVSHYRGLDGALHILGERAESPIYHGLDLGDIFPSVDLLPDELPQAQLTKDSSFSQQIIQQATKGIYA